MAKKKKWTRAERDAFAKKMKRARASKGGTKTKTKRRKKTLKKTTVRKAVSKIKRSKRKGVPAMAKRKHHRRSSAGSAKKSYRRTRKIGGGGMGKAGVMNMVKNAAIAIGGGLIAGAVANKLPIQQPLLKALSPAAAGIILLLTLGKKNAMLQQLATGMVVMGGVAGIRAQFPNVPLLAGEESVMISPDLLGQDEYDELPDYSNMGVQEIGVEEIAGEEYLTAANM
jgi:hypothetical protein